MSSFARILTYTPKKMRQNFWQATKGMPLLSVREFVYSFSVTHVEYPNRLPK